MKTSNSTFESVFFRVDSSREIGGGHVYRCLTLAKDLRQRGRVIQFLCKRLDGNLGRLIRSQGYRVAFLPAHLSQSDDAVWVIKRVKRAANPLVIVDHYGLSFDWESRVAGRYLTLVIDDLARGRHVCQGYLNQNFLKSSDFKTLTFKSGYLVKKFLGPKFALLRHEFRQASNRESSKQRSGVLVFFGSYDGSGETIKLLRAIKASRFDIKIKVIVTRANPHLKKILAMNLPPHLSVVVEPRSLAKLFKQAAFFVGAGGTVTWERMACGLPGIVVSVAPNQEKIAANLQRAGCQVYWGRSSRTKYEEVLRSTRKIMRNTERIKKMREKCRSQIDHLRVENLLELSNVVWLREAQFQDARFLFDLRRDPEVASVSISKGKFSFSSHVKWLKSRLQDPSSRIYIAMKGNMPVGQVRIDSDLTVSIAIVPHMRGQGLGGVMLKLAEDRFVEDVSRYRRRSVTAYVQKVNRPSLKLFKSCGYKQVRFELIHGEQYAVFAKRLNPS